MEFIIDTVDFKEIQQNIMTKEEYRKINNKLALQKAEKFVSDDNDKIDIGKLAELSGLDFQGRDAVLFSMVRVKHLSDISIYFWCKGICSTPKP